MYPDDVKLNALVDDMLRYGAAAQLYKDYKTDDLPINDFDTAYESDETVAGKINDSHRTAPVGSPAGVTFRVENGMLNADGAEDGTSVTLYNLSGTIVRQATLQGGSISLAGLQRGVYAVQLGKLGSTLIRL
jgi:hypothetical protein